MVYFNASIKETNPFAAYKIQETNERAIIEENKRANAASLEQLEEIGAEIDDLIQVHEQDIQELTATKADLCICAFQRRARIQRNIDANKAQLKSFYESKEQFPLMKQAAEEMKAQLSSGKVYYVDISKEDSKKLLSKFEQWTQTLQKQLKDVQKDIEALEGGKRVLDALVETGMFSITLEEQTEEERAIEERIMQLTKKFARLQTVKTNVAILSKVITGTYAGWKDAIGGTPDEEMDSIPKIPRYFLTGRQVNLLQDLFAHGDRIVANGEDLHTRSFRKVSIPGSTEDGRSSRLGSAQERFRELVRRSASKLDDLRSGRSPGSLERVGLLSADATVTV